MTLKNKFIFGKISEATNKRQLRYFSNQNFKICQDIIYLIMYKAGINIYFYNQYANFDKNFYKTFIKIKLIL